MASSSSSRWSSFSDIGLTSIAEFSPATTHLHPFVSRTGFHLAAAPHRRSSFINLVVSASSLRSVPGHIFDTRFDEPTVNPPHFLDSCSLCKKPLFINRDIYIGDMPFCSEECRREHIEADEASEKTRSISSSMKALRNKQKDSQQASSPAKSQKYPLRTGITAA